MLLKELINKSIYGLSGYISSQKDIDLLEQYVVHNLPVLKEFKQIIVVNSYDELNGLRDLSWEMWKKYFENPVMVSRISKGHSFGAAENDNEIFNYCKNHKIEWLCKSANDIVLDPSLLNKEIGDSDFYYLNGIGYGGMQKYDFDSDRIVKEDFYPQTNFYFIKVSKCDYLNDQKHVDEIYNKVKNLPDYNGRAWEYGFKSCETLLRECVERNKLSKEHLIREDNYLKLIDSVMKYQIHDPSHKNIMLEGVCHFHFPDQPVLEI